MDVIQSLDSVRPALWLTLKIATWATFISSTLAILLGYFTSRPNFKGGIFLDALLKMPLILPPTVLGYYLLVFLGRKSYLGQFLDQFHIHLIFSWQGAVVASAVVAFPLVYSNVKASLEQLPSAQIEAARLLGLSAAKTFTRVELPLARNGIIAGMLLAFARALGEFGATFMVAGSLPHQTQTLSVAIYEAVQAGQDHQAAYMVTILSAVGLFIMVATGYLSRRNKWRA